MYLLIKESSFEWCASDIQYMCVARKFQQIHIAARLSLQRLGTDPSPKKLGNSSTSSLTKYPPPDPRGPHRTSIG